MWINKNEWKIIRAVTIGGILEWYEVFLYVYWAHIIGKLFFAPSNSEIISLSNTFFIFAFGLMSRPLGGLIFGHIGDRFGRRIAFIISIVAISIPSFIIGFLPSYATIGVAASIILGALRFFQGIPAGGELPGAMCYLGESASKKNLILMCSFVFVGPQIGGIIGLIESYMFEIFFTEEIRNIWGMRISFTCGGLFALFGLYLRKKLKETPSFHELEEKHQISQSSISAIFRLVHKYKAKIIFTFFLSIFEVVGYFIIAVFPIAYFEKLFGIKTTTNLMITSCLLTFSVITIPLFGLIGNKYSTQIKKFLYASAIGTVIFCILLYFAVNERNLLKSIAIEAIIILFLNMQFALLPSILIKLVPTDVRFTCLGLGFNFCDGFIGGLSTYFALHLIDVTGNPGSFVYLLATAAVISSIALVFVKNEFYNDSLT